LLDFVYSSHSRLFPENEEISTTFMKIGQPKLSERGNQRGGRVVTSSKSANKLTPSDGNLCLKEDLKGENVRSKKLFRLVVV
jgi:hypothetical protein